jgi:hypothetical protein
LQRQFHVTEQVGLRFRAEFFNIFNHPNFGSSKKTLSGPLFGRSTQMLASFLGSAARMAASTPSTKSAARVRSSSPSNFNSEQSSHSSLCTYWLPRLTSTRLIRPGSQKSILFEL